VSKNLWLIYGNATLQTTGSDYYISRPMISIIVPFYKEEANVAALYTRLSHVLDTIEQQWELVCVNDGSQDGTHAELLALQQRDSRVRVVDLSRRFGKEAALTAGLDYGRGEAAIPLDADLQDPPEVIPLLLGKWREGYEVVNAVRASRAGESFLRTAATRGFYWLFRRLSEVEMPPDAGDFRLISRPALQALRRLPERRRFMKGLFAWVGFRTAAVTYDRPPRLAGRSSWNYWKLLNFALDGLIAFSTLPLRLASYLGLAISALAFLYAGVIVFRKLAFGNVVPGYSSLMAAILLLSGVQLVSLGIIGEYLGRLYEESKRRPIYIVRQIWEAKPSTDHTLRKGV